MSILQKRLYRSREESMVAGVIGGAAEYMGGIDPTILRLAFVFLTVVTGFVPGLAVYIMAWMIVPEKPKSSAPRASEAAVAVPEPEREPEQVA
jgi:phage shock protein C